ncbi:hypothetical protein K1T71_001769 [Dendrolimus kikuchii]|uniref:Uncharacterized protein n=1 Tax=Dendrolimus kikuchii TaxID=765133 RepID=A0ACC1DEV9_9NEOP|nr:hypothetical protein K1T71_001769 [Dendrolimus kikuchii]
MSTKLNTLLEMFKNLKSDAVPRAPRPPPNESNVEEPENDENVDSNNEPGITIEEIDDENIKKEEKKKYKNPFFKSTKEKDSFKPNKDKAQKQKGSKIYTQATGNVINIVNSKDIHWGNQYYLGQTTMGPKPHQNHEEEESQLHIKKTNIIVLLLEANVKPQHIYLDYISKNLGMNWRKFFRSLGYRDGRIQTCEIDASRYGVSEARYQLLLDWVKNDDNGTLGHLAELLWEEGERQIVHDLALMYKKQNTQKNDK